jgi:hypothetical protein
MKKSVNWKEAQERYYRNVAEVMNLLGIENDNDVNLLRNVKRLQKELAKAEKTIKELVELTCTRDVGQALSRVTALMNKAGASKVALAEKYNLDTSFLQGIGDKWDKRGEGRDQLKVFASMEKKIELQRQWVTEAYIFMLELVEQTAEEAEYDYERAQALMVAWHEDMEEKFHELTALEFWQEFKGNALKLNLNLDKGSKTVSLVEAKHLCQDYYPALLVSELFADEEQLGEIYEHRLTSWEEKADKARTLSKKEREYELRRYALEVMSLALYRNIKGPTMNRGQQANPKAQELILLANLLALPEDQSQEPLVELNDSTQLYDMVTAYVTTYIEPVTEPVEVK